MSMCVHLLDKQSHVMKIVDVWCESPLSRFSLNRGQPVSVVFVGHSACLIPSTIRDKTDFEQLKAAFQEHFAYGPHNWILSQQLSARKQAKMESIDDYIADIGWLCKCLTGELQ